MSKLRQRFLDRFGVKRLDLAFYGEEWSLRFDLGGEWDVEGGQIPRMLQAVDRARAVTEAAFGDSALVQAVVRKWRRRRPGLRNKAFRRVGIMGFGRISSTRGPVAVLTPSLTILATITF